MEKKQKVNGKMALLGVILLCVILGGYFYLRNKDQQGEGNVKLTEGEQLLALDLENNYPETPTAVMKIYSRLNKYLYNNTSKSNEEVNQLIEVLRGLYSEEFLAINPLDTNLKDFKAEIAEYKKQQQKIMTYQIQSNKLIETWKDDDGKECAGITVVFNISKKKDRIKLYQRFVLIKDKDGRWKIHGWKVSPEVDMGTKEVE